MADVALALCRQLITMAMYMGLGVILIKTKIFGQDSRRNLTTFVLYIVSPMLSLSCFNFEYSAEVFGRFALCVFVSMLFHFGSIVVSMLAKIKADPELEPTERFGVIFGNAGFIGMPLTISVLGTIGGFYCVAFNIMFNVFSWTYGFALLGKIKGKRSFKSYLKLFNHPFFYMTAVGLVMYLLHLSFPVIVQNAVDNIANMTSPLAMICCGMYIADYNAFRGFKKPRVYYVCLLRLVAVPLITLAVLKLVHLDRTMALSVLVAASAPLASVTIFFADGSKARLERSMEMFLMTILLSIVTLPLIVGFASTVL